MTTSEDDDDERIHIVGSGEDPPWEEIPAPSSRVSRPERWIRGHLGDLMCRKYLRYDAVVCDCPVPDEDDDEHGHALWIRRHGHECENVSFRCESGHASADIIEGILARIR